MILVLQFLKAHWKGFAVALAVFLAYGFGRWGVAPNVVTKTETVTKVETVEGKEKIVYRDRKVFVDRVVTRTVTKDGTVKEVITDKSHSETAKSETAKEVKAVDQLVTAKTEKTVTSDAPRLTVMLLAGTQIKPSVNLIPNVGPLSFGVAVNYRVAGPITLGVWGVTTGAFGLSVGAQF